MENYCGLTFTKNLNDGIEDSKNGSVGKGRQESNLSTTDNLVSDVLRRLMIGDNFFFIIKVNLNEM